jgi:hypothetical protein
MPIDCWKTCSSTYATIISSTKSIGKIVKFISPKLTDYYIQMGRSIYIDEQRQIHWLIYLINWRTTRDPLTYIYRLLTDNDIPINIIFSPFGGKRQILIQYNNFVPLRNSLQDTGLKPYISMNKLYSLKPSIYTNILVYERQIHWSVYLAYRLQR